jgi:RimJ/RimL family protein N-acetyltransferase
MTTTIFIPLNERRNHFPLLSEIAEACFGDNDKANFSEEFVPPGGKVPAPKAENFVRFLGSRPKLLWAIQHNAKTVGFILISDIPYQNSIGFGIDVNYAGKGIVTEAFNQIKCHEQIIYPLYGYTSVNNTRANNLLTKLGFELNGEVNFLGEHSFKYVKKNVK